MRSFIRSFAAALFGGVFFAAAAIAQTTPARVPITSLPNARTPFDSTEKCLVVQTGNVLLAPCGAVGVTVAATAPASPSYATMWWDNSSSPASLKIFDGAQWIAIAKLDSAGHVYAVDGVTLSGTLTLTGTISGGTISGATFTGITIDCGASTCTNIPVSSLVGIIASANLPAATTTAIGAVKRVAPVSSNWINSIDATGAPQLSRPACADISNASALCTKNAGTTVLDPGTGALEAEFPYQTITGNGHSFVAADLGKDTRRTNSGLAMADTLPPATTSGLVNGTRVPISNADASAVDTVSAGSGTSLAAGDNGKIDAGRTIVFIYDAPNTTWRRSQNTGTAAVFAATGSLTPGNLPQINSANGQVSDSGISAASVPAPSGSFTVGDVVQAANTSGTSFSDSGLSASTLTTASNAQTLTNKSIDTAGAGNVVKVSGTAVTALSGTGGTLVTNTSPTISNPTATGTLNGAAGTFSGNLQGAKVWATTRNVAAYGGTTPTGVTSGIGAYRMMGVGSLVHVTPATTGRVRITLYGYVTSTAGTTTVYTYAAYGTGTAPANGAAATGTQIGTSIPAIISGGGSDIPIAITEELTGLSLGTAYWFDLALFNSTTGTASITVGRYQVEEF